MYIYIYMYITRDIGVPGGRILRLHMHTHVTQQWLLRLNQETLQQYI
jgi:hypothetical protein